MYVTYQGPELLKILDCDFIGQTLGLSLIGRVSQGDIFQFLSVCFFVLNFPWFQILVVCISAFDVVKIKYDLVDELRTIPGSSYHNNIWATTETTGRKKWPREWHSHVNTSLFG